MRILLPIGLLAALLFPSSFIGAEEPILGTWALARADGLHPKDVPPGGFSNLLVEFTDEGTVRSWLPLSPETANSGPFLLEGNKLIAWLGLSNDKTSPRRVAFPAEGWLELELLTSDGFAATFRRIGSDEEPTLRCVPFTVAGYVSDPGFIQEAREALFSFEPGLAPEFLRGRREASVGSGEEGRYDLDLLIEADRSVLTIRSLEYPDMPPRVREGNLEVSGQYLRTDSLSCGAIHRYDVSGEVLTLKDGNSFDGVFLRAK